MLLAWVTSGCVVETTTQADRVGVHDGEDDAIETITSVPDRIEHHGSPVAHCDGTPLEPCPAGTTGPSCGLSCTADAGECGFRLYCHGDGSVYGLAAIGARLYETAYAATLEESAEAVADELVAWITAHEPDLGLAPGLDDGDVELVPAPAFVQRVGGLTILRFDQRYRGRPVLPPDHRVRLVLAGANVVQIGGRIVDGRVDYEGHEGSATAGQALVSIRHHASVQTMVPADEIEVEGLALVAMPEPQQVAWVGHARYGGSMLARVIVAADPVVGPILPRLSFRPLEAADLVSTEEIQVRTADPATDPADFGTSVETTLVSGEALLGSMDDESGQVQLATEAVVVLDLNGGSRDELETVASRILDPTGEFLASSGAAFTGQITHHLMHSWYARIDAFLTDPASGTKQWDSAVPVYLPGAESPTPAGTYAPRMLAFVNSTPSDCPMTAVACADFAGYGEMAPQAAVFPELVHQPPGAAPGFEATGRITIHPPGQSGDNIITLAHEFGHVADLFIGAGMTEKIAPDCGNACTFECVEDTSDEAPALGETISQLFGLLLLHDAFAPVDFEYCGIVGELSRNNTKAFDPGPCIPAGEDISLLERPDACTKPAPYCDKPTAHGFWLDCCEPGVDPDCIIAAPFSCDSGFQRQRPTGLCSTSPGYNTHSLMQAFWQLLHGQHCEPTAPFDCQTSPWVPGADPADVTIAAFLYSLRLDPLSYQQLIDGMAAHVACTHGTDAYEEFNAIACAHGLRGCADPPPVKCQTCGNGVREGTETCDGLDWAVATCSDFGDFVGGELQCDATTCQLDASLCTEPPEGLDSTAGTGHDAGGTTTGPPATATETGTETDNDWAGTSSDGGCACQAGTRRHDPMALLMLLACIGRRRRRSVS